MSGTYKLRPDTYVNVEKLGNDLNEYFKSPPGCHFTQADNLSFKTRTNFTRKFGTLGKDGKILIIKTPMGLFLSIYIFDDMMEEVVRRGGNVSDFYIADKYDKASCRDVAVTVMQSLYLTVDKASIIRMVDASIFSDMLEEVDYSTKGEVMFVYKPKCASGKEVL